LVDFWSNTCGACIAAMPRIERVYEKYKNRGFEVVGINHAGAVDEKKLKEATNLALKKLGAQGASWPNGIITWSLDEIDERLGVRYVPYTLLLDQTGRLVTTETDYEKLEENVKRLLTP